ncbi:MAG: hypothetical protein ISS90_00630 [Candidatus Omnitrophica bacterium]|nr:hypothetical protein [Candidatus Omnitrophota bacterium]
MKKFILVIFVIIGIFSLVYFVQPNKVKFDEGADLWNGTWVSEKTAKKGEFEFSLEKAGEAFSGYILISGSPITKGGRINGVIKGNEIKFGLSKNKRGELTYVGTISNNTMLGTWQIPIIKDRGSWEASKKK